MGNIDIKDLLSAQQVAILKGVTRQTVYRAIRLGKLETVTVMDKTAVLRSAAEAWQPMPKNSDRAGLRFGGRPKTIVDQPKRPVGRPKKRIDDNLMGV